MRKIQFDARRIALLWFTSTFKLHESAKFTLTHAELKKTSCQESETAELDKIEFITPKKHESGYTFSIRKIELEDLELRVIENQ